MGTASVTSDDRVTDGYVTRVTDGVTDGGRVTDGVTDGGRVTDGVTDGGRVTDGVTDGGRVTDGVGTQEITTVTTTTARQGTFHQNRICR